MKKTIVIFLVIINVFISTNVALAADGSAEKWQNNPGYSSLLWYRDSAEMRAIYHEVYSEAREYIKQNAEGLTPKTWGIILDIDETAVDNSLNALEQMQSDTSFSNEAWAKWKQRELATALPGIRSLVNLVHIMGGYVNFISNGDISLLTYYENDLQKYDIYYDQILLTPAGTSMSDKNPRFVAVQKGEPPSKLPPQTIIAWFGDNIQDFPGLWQRDVDNWDIYNDSLWEKFGHGWFILPNPMYGSWQANKLQ